jgi:chromosome segregation ATPase
MSTGEKCSGHEYMEKEMQKYHENQLQIVQGLHIIRERVSSLETNKDVLEDRVDQMHKHTEAIWKMTMSVERLTEEMGSLKKDASDRNTNILIEVKRLENMIRDVADKSKNKILEYLDGAAKAIIVVVALWLLYNSTGIGG